MRYSASENTTLVGLFDPGLTVTIQILNLDTNTIVNVSDSSCTESAIPGVYIWNTANITDVLDNANLLYVMTTNTGKTFYGKFTYGGVIDKIANDADMSRSYWEIMKDKILTVNKFLSLGNR